MFTMFLNNTPVGRALGAGGAMRLKKGRNPFESVHDSNGFPPFEAVINRNVLLFFVCESAFAN